MTPASLWKRLLFPPLNGPGTFAEKFNIFSVKYHYFSSMYLRSNCWRVPCLSFSGCLLQNGLLDHGVPCNDYEQRFAFGEFGFKNPTTASQLWDLWQVIELYGPRFFLLEMGRIIVHASKKCFENQMRYFSAVPGTE